MTWMTVEMKSRMRATVPLRTSNGSYSVHNVNKVNDDGNKATHNKCWLCKSPTHWPDQCQKFATLNADDRLKAVKDNHACFSCLKEHRPTGEHIFSYRQSRCPPRCYHCRQDFTSVEIYFSTQERRLA